MARSARRTEAPEWVRGLSHDPVEALLSADNAAVRYFARRDLLDDSSASIDSVWALPEVDRIVARQQPDGRWKYPGGKPAIRSRAGYDQLETYRQLGVLVYKYELTRRHPAIAGAAAFLGSGQTDAGDYRGIYGNQYSPNYSAAITELLLRAGYGRSTQVENAMRWLISIRQDDGGWAIPSRTRDLPLTVMSNSDETFEPDRSRPSSHLVTGIVMRALASHPRVRRTSVTRRAGELLKSRFFTRDAYPDHVAADYWLIFSYPFWWTDLLSALDALTRAGFSATDADIARGLRWFVDHQAANGFWNPGRNRPKRGDSDEWVALAVCRLLKRSFEGAAAT